MQEDDPGSQCEILGPDSHPAGRYTAEIDRSVLLSDRFSHLATFNVEIVQGIVLTVRASSFDFHVLEHWRKSMTEIFSSEQSGSRM